MLVWENREEIGVSFVQGGEKIGIFSQNIYLWSSVSNGVGSMRFFSEIGNSFVSNGGERAAPTGLISIKHVLVMSNV